MIEMLQLQSSCPLGVAGDGHGQRASADAPVSMGEGLLAIDAHKLRIQALLEV